MSITWGNYSFDGPYQITGWNPPYRSAVYAIMKKASEPNSYTIIYFGESENLSERGFISSHHKYSCFIDEAGAESNLYIGIYLMPNSTQEERQAVESKLVSKYNPACND